MRNEPVKKIIVPEGSSLAKILTDAAGRPLLLEKNGDLYRLERMETTADVAQSREGILRAAGSWQGVDTEARLRHTSKNVGILAFIPASEVISDAGSNASAYAAGYLGRL